MPTLKLPALLAATATILQPRPREKIKESCYNLLLLGIHQLLQPWTDASPQIRNLDTLFRHFEKERERKGSIPYIRTVLRCAVPIQSNRGWCVFEIPSC